MDLSTKIIIISYSVALLSETFCALRNVAFTYFEEKLFVFFGKMGIMRFVHYAFLKNKFFKNLSNVLNKNAIHVFEKNIKVWRWMKPFILTGHWQVCEENISCNFHKIPFIMFSYCWYLTYSWCVARNRGRYSTISFVSFKFTRKKFILIYWYLSMKVITIGIGRKIFCFRPLLIVQYILKIKKITKGTVSIVSAKMAMPDSQRYL